MKKCDTKVVKTGEHCPEIPKHKIDEIVYLCDKCLETYKLIKKGNTSNFYYL